MDTQAYKDLKKRSLETKEIVMIKALGQELSAVIEKQGKGLVRLEQ